MRGRRAKPPATVLGWRQRPRSVDQQRRSKVNADLENLIVLQAQDLELGRLRAELVEAPRRVKAAEAAMAAAEAGLAKCRAALAEEEKLRRAQDRENGTLRAKLERLRTSLDGATNAQQVSAFEHEIAFANKAIEQLDEESFASAERTEAVEAEQTAALAGLARAGAALAAERESAASLKARHEVAVAGLERERASLRQMIEPARLSSYDRLTRTRGSAVAEAIGNATSGKCTACQMGVRPQRWQDLIGRDHTEEIFPCETCGRMLFWDPRRDTPRAWTAGDRLNSAQAGALPAAKEGAAR